MNISKENHTLTIFSQWLPAISMLLLLQSGITTWAQVPGSPSITSTQGINTGGMIFFTSPASSGGSSITNYEYSIDNGSTWVTPSPASIDSPLIIHSGLTNCTTYDVKIRAVNSTGAGAASTTATLTPTFSTGTPGVTWTSRSSAADHDWRSVTYGNGLFVAVAFSGANQVMTSLDGINWTSRAAASNNFWTSVTYGNGLFVAVASNGSGNRVMTSDDGINWASRSSAADYQWTSITYGNGLFVAVAQSSCTQPCPWQQVMTSPDGINWTLQTSIDTGGWASVTYGNGLFVAVGSNSNMRAMTSSNGIDWTSRSLPVFSSYSSVTYGNGRFVAVSNLTSGNQVIRSTDGINWVNSSAFDQQWMSVTYGNGLFVAVAQSGTGNRVMTSPDGETWTSRTSAADTNWRGVAYGKGVFVAVANNGSGNRVMTSGFEIAPDVPLINSITQGNGQLGVAFTNSVPAGSPAVSNMEFSSDNGNTWDTRTPTSTVSPVTISGLANATLYNIQLRAINSVGTGCPASILAATQFPDINFCPGLPSDVQTLNLGYVDFTNTVTITAPSGFEIRKSSDPGFSSMISLPLDGSGNLVTTSVDIRVTESATVTMTADVSITSGTDTVSLTVTATAAPPENINVQGNNLNIFAGDANPDTADDTQFGVVAVNVPATKTYTIQNTGTGNLVVSAISLAGADAGSFVIGGISLPATIAQGSSTTFTVSITANSPGLKAATVVITSNDTCSVTSPN